MVLVEAEVEVGAAAEVLAVAEVVVLAGVISLPAMDPPCDFLVDLDLDVDGLDGLEVLDGLATLATLAGFVSFAAGLVGLGAGWGGLEDMARDWDRVVGRRVGCGCGGG